MLTVVMYHYVRPLTGGRWPRLKALDLQDFRGQLDWLAQNHNPIGPSDLQLALTQGAPLPPRACLLTFDDGYSDHHDHVAPLLADHGMKGIFFAPFSSLVGRRVLEVNKIQLVLASLAHPETLADELDILLHEQDLADPAALRSAHFMRNRFDSAPVAYAKRLLQHVLPPGIRSLAVETLFHRHVTSDDAGLAEELYLSPAQARDMRAAGHEFGGHGDLHLWHAQATVTELAAEISGSARALQHLGAPVAGGFYCYPFGNQNAAVRDAAAEAGFQIGFTVEPSACDPSTVDPLRIPRLDTNDLPKGPA